MYIHIHVHVQELCIGTCIYMYMYMYVNVYVCVRCTIVCVLALEYLVGVYSDRGMNYCIRGLLHIHVCYCTIHVHTTHKNHLFPLTDGSTYTNV